MQYHRTLWLLAGLLLAAQLSACSPIDPRPPEPAVVTPQPDANPEATATDYVNAGLQAIAERDVEAAIDAFTNAIDLDPDMAVAYLHRGNAYAEAQEAELAIADLDRAIELAPDMPIAYTSRADAYMLRGDVEAALADLSRALSVDPEDANVYVERG